MVDFTATVYMLDENIGVHSYNPSSCPCHAHGDDTNKHGGRSWWTKSQDMARRNNSAKSACSSSKSTCMYVVFLRVIPSVQLELDASASILTCFITSKDNVIDSHTTIDIVI